MWGREMRAGLVFVLVSLLVGGAFREWRRAHEMRFADLVSSLESQDLATKRGSPADRGAPDSSMTAAIVDSRRTPPGGQSPGRRPSPPLAPARIDLDRATAHDLERLPGIGPALAARIIADRVDRGPFGSPSALLRVRGIGPRTLDRIRPYLVGPPAVVDSGSPIAN
jgi:competence ComEA-like helix-hairpin-helix protein